MAAVVGMVSGRDLSIHTHHENRVNQCYISRYFAVTVIYKIAVVR